MRNKYLIDTHILLWFLLGDNSLSASAKKVLSTKTNMCYVSLASIWEIAIKMKLGKLRLQISLEELIEATLKFNIEILPISLQHIVTLMDLDDIHRDPFDRIIIASAITEMYPIVTKDQHFSKYKSLEVIW